jgi:hypothetical protein
MDDKIKTLRIKEIDSRITNLRDNIRSMERKIKELSDKRSELVTENIVFDRLYKLGLIQSYSHFIKSR